jgi:O-antigen/teichoic acid export membrane protein
LNFLQRSGITLTARVGIFVLGLINAVALARMFGPEGKGAFALLTVVPMMAIQGLSLGMALANTYFVGQRKATPRQLAENALVFALGMGTAALLVYFFTKDWWNQLLFKGIEPSWAKAVMAALPVLLLWYLYNHLSLALNRIVEFNLPNLLRPAVFLISLVLLWSLLDHSFSSAVLAWWISVLLMAGTAVYFVYRRVRFGVGFHLHVFRESVSFGVKGYVGSIMQLLYLRVDYILLNFYLSSTEVGFYSVAVVMAEVLWFFPNTIAVVLLPEVAHSVGEESDRLTLQLCRNTLMLSLAAGLLLAWLARPLIDLAFTPAFRPAMLPLWLLLPGIAISSIGKILGSYLVGRGKPLLSTTAAAATLVSNLGLNFWLIPRWGVAGAALASTMSYSIGTAVYLAALVRVSGASLAQAVIVQREDWQFYRTLWERSKRVFGNR